MTLVRPKRMGVSRWLAAAWLLTAHADPSKLTPVIFVPGLGGSVLEARLSNRSAHRDCSTTADWCGDGLSGLHAFQRARRICSWQVYGLVLRDPGGSPSTCTLLPCCRVALLSIRPHFCMRVPARAFSCARVCARECGCKTTHHSRTRTAHPCARTTHVGPVAVRVLHGEHQAWR